MPSQTNPYQLPYLLPSDPVRDIATNTQNLAVRLATIIASGELNGAKGDTGQGIALAGHKATAALLPAQPVPPGVAYTTDDGHLHVSDGAAWHDLGALQGIPGPPGETGPYGPVVSVLRTTTQTIANSADTIIGWSSVEYDSQPGGQSQYNGNNGLVCRQTGLYYVDGALTWGASAVGRRAMRLTRNSTTTNAFAGQIFTSNSWDNVNNAGRLVRLAAGDVVRMLVSHDAGANLAAGVVLWGDTHTRLSMAWIAP